jgi:hypothetical protein
MRFVSEMMVPWAFILSLMGMLIWCAVFLKVEPNLSRAGIIILVILFVSCLILAGMVEEVFQKVDHKVFNKQDG